MMIDTSSSIAKKKDFASPVKSKPTQNGFKSDTKAPQNIFATIKTKPSPADIPMKQFIPEADEEMEEELEDEDDPEIQARKKLLKLLEKGNDDYDDEDDGVAIEYNSGDEGGAPNGEKDSKGNKANGNNLGNENGDMDEDDDIMGDEY